ncbi:hypothetical protein SATMO3_13050 [Sporomusa aerivorans]
MAFNQVGAPGVAPAGNPFNLSALSVGKYAADALERYPGSSLRAVYLDYERMTAGFSLQSTGKGSQYVRLDLSTGRFIDRSDQQVKYEFIPKFIDSMYRMHVDMYLGEWGRKLLGFMCGLSIVALLSGLWLYAPFTRTLTFGTIRTAHRRSCWIDWHKLLGVATLSWAVLLSASGFIFVFAGPVYNAWNEITHKEFLQEYQGRPYSAPRILIDDVLAIAKAAVPDRRVTGIEMPQAGGRMPWHYTIRTQGEGFAAYINKPVWIDASTGAITAIIELPWYIQALAMARPVHFSNHDTLLLKSLWFIIDAFTCIMIVTGMYAWFVKFRPKSSVVKVNSQSVAFDYPVRQSPRQIWQAPIAVILLTGFGIIAPLASKEWNVISAFALAMPIVLAIYYCFRR